jgi:hypothetical protein
MSTETPEIPLRIIVLKPPPGVRFAVQRGRDELVPPVEASPERLVFDLTVRVSGARSGPPRLTGPFAQGPPAARFVYVSSGTLAGQPESCWTRRAKVPLTAIDWDLIERLKRSPGSVLAAEIGGVARDGGPVCASVPLASGWRVRQGKSG